MIMDRKNEAAKILFENGFSYEEIKEIVEPKVVEKVVEKVVVKEVPLINDPFKPYWPYTYKPSVKYEFTPNTYSTNIKLDSSKIQGAVARLTGEPTRLNKI